MPRRSCESRRRQRRVCRRHRLALWRKFGVRGESAAALRGQPSVVRADPPARCTARRRERSRSARRGGGGRRRLRRKQLAFADNLNPEMKARWRTTSPPAQARACRGSGRVVRLGRQPWRATPIQTRSRALSRTRTEPPLGCRSSTASVFPAHARSVRSCAGAGRSASSSRRSARGRWGGGSRAKARRDRERDPREGVARAAYLVHRLDAREVAACATIQGPASVISSR